jgi:hypothetical protein
MIASVSSVVTALFIVKSYFLTNPPHMKQLVFFPYLKWLKMLTGRISTPDKQTPTAAC